MPEFNHEIITNRLPHTKSIEIFSKNAIIKRFEPTAYSSFQEKWLRRRSSLIYSAGCEIVRTLKERRYLKNTEYDILHVHETNHDLISLDVVLKTNVFSKIAKNIYNFNKFKKPLLLSMHYHIVKNVYHQKVINYEYKFISQFENIIVVDKKIFDDVIEYFEKTNQDKNIWFIPNGVDLDKYTDVIKSILSC
ncbi:MAG: glycosyltransferase family 4 protein [Candidatus Methanoperedens sp.]|nr:glycosyltransferase family 4 protein [Candidatus Methanoperedens sp.]